MVKEIITISPHICGWQLVQFPRGKPEEWEKDLLPSWQEARPALESVLQHIDVAVFDKKKVTIIIEEE